MATTRLTISLLGSFQVELNGTAVTQFGSDTARALLAYLALHPHVAHRRDALAGLLWPEQSNTAALRNLRVALSRLRNAIGDREADAHLLEVTSRTIQFADNETCLLDVQAMRTALATITAHDHVQLDACASCAEHLNEVAALYRGDFLAGFSLDSVPFEEWMVVERENCHWQALEALFALTSFYQKQGNYEAAIDCARRQIELEPWRESAHRQWMRALALSSRRGAALAQFDACRKVLSEELGVEPETETLALVEQIRVGILASPPHNIAAERAGVVSPIAAGSHAIPTVMTMEAAILQSQLEVPPFPEGERRIITVAQADISGGEVLFARIGNEVWASIVSQLSRAIGVEIHRFGGEVDRYDERSLVAFFGAQVTHEDDPERGVLAALAMQQAFHAQLAQLTDKVATLDDLDVRIAVHTGAVIITAVEGDGGTGRRTVIGDAIQSASRLLAETSPGEVRVSETTYRLVEPLFEWSLQSGYIPLNHKLRADKGRGLPGMYSALVGRDYELHSLCEAVARLQSGIGGIVTLVGEAGIGKSRLVAEVRESTDVRWLEGRCLSYSGTLAYVLWQDVLRALLGVTAEASPAIVDHALRAHVRALDAERFDASYAYLGKLLSVFLDAEAEALVSQMNAENLQSGTFYAVERLLERAATHEPLVIVCEDLHWADSTSLALLGQLLTLTDRVPLLLICVLRPRREHGCWQIRETALRAYPHRHVDVQLEALSTVEGETLLENLLLSLPGPDERKPVEGLPDVLKAQILARSEGNPFYVEEILRALIRSGAVVCEAVSCRWEALDEVVDINIPETLYGVLRSRIDQLPAGARHVLHLASVIGRIFPKRLLAAIAERDGLDANLITLQREQLIRERARLPEAEYIFQHQLTLEAAYGGLLQRLRHVLHRRVADTIEQLYAERIDEQLGLLAQHWEQAGETERAVAYLRRAGQQAAAQYANAEAIDYFSRALALLPDTDLDERYDVLLKRETVYDLIGLRDAQRADLTRLQELATVLDDGTSEAARRFAEVALHEAKFYSATHNYAGQAGAAQRAVRMAQLTGDASVEAESWMQSGFTLFYHALNSEQAKEHWEKAVKLTREAGDRHLEAQILREMGIAFNNAGRISEAKPYIEQTLRIYVELGDRWGEGRAQNILGMLALESHHLTAAIVHLEDGLRLCRQTGNRYDEAWSLRPLGGALCRLGQYTTGDENLREAYELFRQVGDPWGEIATLYTRGKFARSVGNDAQSLVYIEQVLNLTEESDDAFVKAEGWITLGDLQSDKARWTEAADAYQKALMFCQNSMWPHRTPSVRARLAYAALSQDKLPVAQTHIESVLSYLETYPELPGSDDPMHVYLLCYRVLSAVDDPRAENILAQGYRLLQGWAAEIEDEALRCSFLENVAENREIVVEYELAHR